MKEMIAWSMLVISLPSAHKTPRMRVWRALKANGAEPLRDGVYVLPESARTREVLNEQACDVIRSGGTAHIVSFMSASEGQQRELVGLFDRVDEYAALLGKVDRLKRRIGKLDEMDARRAVLSVRRDLDAVTAIDFFPSASHSQIEVSLADVETALDRRLSPDEPRSAAGDVSKRDPLKYRGRTWATREHLWIDRVASAWLIRRFVDPKARFQWIAKSKDCPKRAVGFDFDGAEFTHVGGRVTFEVLLAAFGLSDDHALARLGALVHYLDVGGVALPEASGFAAVAAGMRAERPTDDAFFAAMAAVFDAFYASFSHTEEDAQ